MARNTPPPPPRTTPPPRRTVSDPTLVLDLKNVISDEARAAFVAALDEPHDPATFQEERTTDVACPSCQRCPDCGGTHLVSAVKRSELLRKETGL